MQNLNSVLFVQEGDDNLDVRHLIEVDVSGI